MSSFFFLKVQSPVVRRGIAISTTAVIFFITVYLKAFSYFATGAIDGDFYMHLTYGLWMLSHHSLPQVDAFSWTFNGHPYEMTQWLGELAIGAAYTVGGLYGTKWLTVGLLAGTLGVCYAAALRYLKPPMALFVAIASNLSLYIVSCRPQLFSFFLFAILSFLVTGYLDHRRRSYLFAIPLVMGLWVNLHGGYVVGLMFLALVWGLECFRASFDHALQERKRHLVDLTVTVALAILATLLNPHGFGAWGYVVEIANLKSTTEGILSEWMPVNIRRSSGQIFLVIASMYLCALVYAKRRPNLTEWGVSFGLLVFGMAAVRQVPLLGAAIVPFTAKLIAETPMYQEEFSKFKNPVYTKCYAAVLIGLLVVFPKLQHMSKEASVERVSQIFPVAALTFMKNNGLKEKVMTDFLEGSYMLFAAPEIKVFVDCRLDLYGDKFFFDYFFARRAAPGWETFLKRYDPEVILLKKEIPLRAVLLQRPQEWKLVHEDEYFSVLVRNIPKFDQLIKDHPVQPDERELMDESGQPRRTVSM